MTEYVNANPFLDIEDQRQRRLAYYGEFLIDLAFDDGYIHSLYPLFLEYLQEIEGEGVTFSSNIIENTRSYIKLVIEAPSLQEKDFQEKLYGQIVTLQSQYLFSPIVQHVGHKIDTGIELPVIVEAPLEKEVHAGRFEIQNIYAQLLKLQGDRNRIQYLITKLQGIDDENVKLLLENQVKIEEHLENQEQKLSSQLEELTAAQYLNNANIIFGDIPQDRIPRETAVIISDIIDSDTPETKIQEWIEPIITEREKLEAMIQGLSGEITNLTEIISTGSVVSSDALESLKPREGLLCDIEVEEGMLIKANIFGSPFTVASNGENLEGFKIEGISHIKSIHHKSINTAGVMSSFFVYSNDFAGKRFYYLQNGKYIHITIDGKSEILEKITKIYLSEDGTIDSQSPKVESNNFCAIFKTGENTFEYLKSDGKIMSFRNQNSDNNYMSDNRLEGTIHSGKIILNKIKNSYYFSNENGNTFILEIDGIDIFTYLTNLTYDKNGLLTGGVAGIANGGGTTIDRLFKKEKNEFRFVTFDGEKNILGKRYVTEDKKIIAGIMKNKSHQSYVFQLHNDTHTLFKIDNIEKFESVDGIEVNTDGNITQGVFYDGEYIHIMRGKEGKDKIHKIKFQSDIENDTFDTTRVEALYGDCDVIAIGQNSKSIYYYQYGGYQELSIVHGFRKRKHVSFYEYHIDKEALENGIFKGTVQLHQDGKKIPFESVVIGEKSI